MEIKIKLRPDFIKCLKAYPGVTVPEIYQATKEIEKQYGLNQEGICLNEMNTTTLA